MVISISPAHETVSITISIIGTSTSTMDGVGRAMNTCSNGGNSSNMMSNWLSNNNRGSLSNNNWGLYSYSNFMTYLSCHLLSDRSTNCPCYFFALLHWSLSGNGPGNRDTFLNRPGVADIINNCIRDLGTGCLGHSFTDGSWHIPVNSGALWLGDSYTMRYTDTLGNSHTVRHINTVRHTDTLGHSNTVGYINTVGHSGTLGHSNTPWHSNAVGNSNTPWNSDTDWGLNNSWGLDWDSPALSSGDSLTHWGPCNRDDRGNNLGVSQNWSLTNNGSSSKKRGWCSNVASNTKGSNSTTKAVVNGSKSSRRDSSSKTEELGISISISFWFSISFTLSNTVVEKSSRSNSSKDRRGKVVSNNIGSGCYMDPLLGTNLFNNIMALLGGGGVNNCR